MDIYLVGGSVRDKILNIESKDLDYVCPVNYDTMKDYLLSQNCEIIFEKPEFLTMKVRFPASKNVVDFTCCRAESDYDGRRPGSVSHSNLLNDLSRRDFTVNAIAQKVNSNFETVDEYIDPFDGLSDIKSKTLRFVGKPKDRIEEDGLRWLRALRFQITKGLIPCERTERVLQNQKSLPELVSSERIREELYRCFKYDTLKTLEILEKYPKIWFRDKLWFKPTFEKI